VALDRIVRQIAPNAFVSYCVQNRTSLKGEGGRNQREGRNCAATYFEIPPEQLCQTLGKSGNRRSSSRTPNGRFQSGGEEILAHRESSSDPSCNNTTLSNRSGRNRRTTHFGIHLVELLCEFLKGLVYHGAPSAAEDDPYVPAAPAKSTHARHAALRFVANFSGLQFESII
jgi:hypothetical protein